MENTAKKNTTVGAITVHRLKSGATVQLYLSANKSLYQIVNTASNSVTPKWTDGEGPTITPILIGGEMVNVRWYLNMPAGTTGTNRDKYLISSGATANKVSVNPTTGALTFTDNIVTAQQTIANQMLTFVCDVITGGSPTEIQRTVAIDVRSGGENSYWGHIEASNGTTLGKRYDGDSSVIESTTLVPSLTLGVKKLPENMYYVKWFKTGAGVDGQDQPITSAWTKENNGAVLGTGNTLIVYRDGVDGSAHFEAHFYLNDNTLVEAEGIQVSDNADTYFIGITGESSVYSDNPNNRVSLTARVYETQTNKLVDVVSQWQVVATDSERMREYKKGTHYTQTGEEKCQSCLFEMVVGQMYVPNTVQGVLDHSKPWLKLGASERLDTPVATVAEASECDVIVQFIATI